MSEADLFENLTSNKTEKGRKEPLADRMRPATLDAFVGQEHLVGKQGILKEMIERDEIPSLIFWGPPGTGKTTLAHIISQTTGAQFIKFSAAISGIRDVKEVIKTAELLKRRTILFIDEIHRFNKAQQDAFLPHVEKGTIILIGATTENPSFEVNTPLLSRTKVLVLNALEPEHISKITKSALVDREHGLGEPGMKLTDEAMELLINYSDGDARRALNALELAASLASKKGENTLTKSHIERATQKKALRYDRAGEEHYNIISALHKSIRDSDPDAGLYWLARMIEGGEDPLYIARRLIRFASEDVGNADPAALPLAIAAKDSYHFLGSPEGELALAQCVVYLATAPKSNRVYTAYNKAMDDARRYGSLPVPLHIRNAPTRLMKDLGYGKSYEYAHDIEAGISAQDHFPDKLKGRKYYEPGRFGFEKTIAERLKWWEEKKREVCKANKKEKNKKK